MKHSMLSLAAVAALTMAVPAMATTYTATLSGLTEVPPNASSASGFATVVITGSTMDVSVTFSGLAVPASAAHIHCCTAPGSNTGVATGLTGFPASISDSYSSSFDMTSAATYGAAFLTDNGGTADSAFAALVKGLNAGMAYVNIHNRSFPGGEIRGNLTPVPEPETYALMLAGLGLVGWAARRRATA